MNYRTNENVKATLIAIAIIGMIAVGVLVRNLIADWLEKQEQEKIDNQLNEVLVACTNDEDSTKCKELQRKYNMTFKYCQVIGDYSKAETITWPDGSTTITWPAKRAVVWQGNSSEPPKDIHNYGVNGNYNLSFSMYTDCTDHPGRNWL